jgi:hypothetical protein
LCSGAVYYLSVAFYLQKQQQAQSNVYITRCNYEEYVYLMVCVASTSMRMALPLSAAAAAAAAAAAVTALVSAVSSVTSVTVGSHASSGFCPVYV